MRRFCDGCSSGLVIVGSAKRYGASRVSFEIALPNKSILILADRGKSNTLALTRLVHTTSDYSVKTKISNRLVELTATRCAFTFFMTNILSLRATLAFGGGGSLLSR